MSNQLHQLIIIGAGPAGYTAAIYAARANLKPLIIEGPKPGGQLMGTSYVENWPGEKSILGPELMMNIKDQAARFDTQFIDETVIKVDVTKRPFTITTKQATYQSQALIIATGAEPKRLGIPGEDQYWGKGVTTCAVCDGAFYVNKPIIIVGGGDTAMEDASFMTKFTDKITIVHILDKLTASHAMQQKVLNDPKIKILYNTASQEITGDGNHVSQLTAVNKQTNEVTTLGTSAIFIAVGLRPNSEMVKGQLDISPYGFIKVTHGTKTSVEGVFAAGDVVDDRYRQAITSAGTGCMAALDAQRYLSDL